jgi:hypothetical protein
MLVDDDPDKKPVDSIMWNLQVNKNHRARIISPLPLRVAKTGRNHLNEEFSPLPPTGIGERF